MGWLAAGIVYSVLYAVIGTLVRDYPTVLSWFRACALGLPPIVAALAITTRRATWRGCQWLFWATISLGLVMSAIGLSGWATEELMSARETWLAWPAVFALFGAVAPLFALLAQPHRGPREPLTATTAVDIAGLTVVTGFLYSFFVTTPATGADSDAASASLILVSELQQGLVVAGMAAASLVAQEKQWASTYRRLALGAFVSFVTLTLSNFEILRGAYRSGFVYDFTWILPFAFVPWAASCAPASDEDATPASEHDELVRPRPWVIFTAVALIPFLDFGLRHVMPTEAKTFRDLSTAVTIVSVLPLLVARIAAERAELQQAGSTVRLMGQVIEQAADLIIVVTPEGRCRHANDAFCRTTGYSRRELEGMRPMELICSDEVRPDDIYAAVQATGHWRGVLTRIRKNGTTFLSSATVVTVVSEDGRATHFVSVERDVSEDRRLREQLIHSERLSAVGQLVSGVAHELNNPLQSVIGLTELLLEEETRTDTRRDLERVRTDAGRAAKIVRSLLTFVRRSTSERAAVDLGETARSTIALRQFDLTSSNITVHEAYGDKVPSVIANPEEIQQIVLNLILNAEHAIRSNGKTGTICVRTGQVNGMAHLDVQDDGPGVPAAVAGQIFEPFFTTKNVGEGTGLGLSISLGIAQAHGGALSLVPTDRGACFRLSLPIRPVPRRSGPRQALARI